MLFFSEFSLFMLLVRLVSFLWANVMCILIPLKERPQYWYIVFESIWVMIGDDGGALCVLVALLEVLVDVYKSETPSLITRRYFWTKLCLYCSLFALEITFLNILSPPFTIGILAMIGWVGLARIRFSILALCSSSYSSMLFTFYLASASSLLMLMMRSILFWKLRISCLIFGLLLDRRGAAYIMWLSA